MLLFVLATAAALTQEPRDPDDEPTALGARWWLTPLEWNAGRRLPYFPVSLEDVVVDGQTVWAIAEDGTIFKSTDKGVTWEVRDDLRPPPEAVAAPKQQPEEGK